MWLLLAGAAFDGLACLEHLGDVHRIALQRQRDHRPNRLSILPQPRSGLVTYGQHEHVAIAGDAGHVSGRKSSDLHARGEDSIFVPDSHRLL